MERESAMHSVHNNIPVRSISLPSRPHPNYLQIEEELAKLKAWQSSSTAYPVGVDTIQIGLTRLAELFTCIDELIHHSPVLPQQSCHHQYFNLVLDGSVGLLDVCSTSRELFLTLRQHVQDLQSALRRRGMNSSVETDIHAYMSFRKKAKKDVTKSLKLLKTIESKNIKSFPFSSEIDSNNKHLLVIKVMTEATGIAISTFRSLLSFLSMPVMKTSCSNGWSLVSKVVRSGLLAYNPDRCLNEVECVDSALCSIQGNFRKNGVVKVDVQEVQQRLETLDVSIKGLEAALDHMFKCFIQNRVSVLNLVTP